MNKYQAKEIAEKITNTELKIMFDNAKANIKDWTKVSSINKGMTKGSAWNILAGAFQESDYNSTLAKTNMIREFGEFLPENLKPIDIKKVKNTVIPFHQEPKF